MKTSSIKFLFIGRIDPIKNMHLFASFLDNFVTFENVHLRIIGPDYGGLSLFPITKKIKLEILPPNYDSDFKQQQLKWADFCVVVSDFEALSFFLLESLKSGVRVVVTTNTWPFSTFSPWLGHFLSAYDFENFSKMISCSKFSNADFIRNFYSTYFNESNIIKKIQSEFCN